jgi:hypothetical protein
MNTLNTIILLASVSTIFIGFFVLIKNYKNPSNSWYFTMCLFGGLWGLMKVVQFSVMDVYWHDLLISRLVMFFGALAPISFVMMTYYFGYKFNKPSKKKICSFIFIAGIVAILNLLGVLRHADISIVDDSLHREIIFRDFLIFALYYFIYIFFGFYILLKKYFISEGVTKVQIKYLIYGTVGNFLTTGVVSIILLLFNNFTYDFLGPIFLLVNFFFIGYLVFIKPKIH